VQFCIRDDDTSFFTTPEQLEYAYGDLTQWGPVSLAVVPYHRAGTSRGVPEKYRGRWTVHALHENRSLVQYLRAAAGEGRYEVMLHGYYHDERDGYEFECGEQLGRRVADGRKYLEDLIGTPIRVFVPPHNAIGRSGLRAVTRAGLHLGGVAGMRGGWPLASARSWTVWLRLRRWRTAGGAGLPWVLDLGDHRELAGNPVTPLSRSADNASRFAAACEVRGAFCAATHYWEWDTASVHADEPTVGGQLQRLVELARSTPDVRWRCVGDVISAPVAD
jgi:hypothetical protein